MTNTDTAPRRRPALSLSTRLALAAGSLGMIALVASFLVVFGLGRTAERIDTALAAESRLQNYAALSSQISSLALVAFEARRENDLAVARRDRIAALRHTITQTFAAISRTLEDEVQAAGPLGMDEQSRRATQGLTLARMRAAFEALSPKLDTVEPETLRAELNVFSTSFQPLLGSAVHEEQRLRDAAYEDVERTRRWLTRAASGLTLATLATLAFFVFGLVRPQLARLERLRDAARAISHENFATTLPETRQDEIGRLFTEVNRMAAILARDRAELNRIIDDRTRALRHANDALRHTDENRRRFFADISHEMRTPLTVILMETELALDESDSAEDSLATIRTRAALLSRRVDDLLRIAKSETGLLSIDKAPFDLSRAAETAARDLERRAERQGSEIAFETPGPIGVLGDRDWIRQIVTGLVDNALRHAGRGVPVRVRVATEGSMGCVRVIDGGAGLGEADPEALLERFRQGEGRGRSDGFGIGLGLARWVAEEHGGHVTLVTPVPAEARTGGSGPGTMATLCLPLEGA